MRIDLTHAGDENVLICTESGGMGGPKLPARRLRWSTKSRAQFFHQKNFRPRKLIIRLAYTPHMLQASVHMKRDVNDDGRRIGEGNPRSRYFDATARMVIRLHEDGYASQSISVLLGLPASTARSITGGYARLQEPAVQEKTCRKKSP